MTTIISNKMATLNGLLKILRIKNRKEPLTEENNITDNTQTPNFTDFIDEVEYSKDFTNDGDSISHIYEEIPYNRLDGQTTLPVRHNTSSLDFSNAREIGSYLVVPLFGCYGTRIFRKDEVPSEYSEILPHEIRSRLNCPRNRQFNIQDELEFRDNLEKSTYCTIPADNECDDADVALSSNEGRKIRSDSDDSCSEYDIHGISRHDYFYYLSRAEHNLKLKREVLKLLNDQEQSLNNKGASSDAAVETDPEDATDCSVRSSDSGNASLYTASDISICSDHSVELICYEQEENLENAKHSVRNEIPKETITMQVDAGKQEGKKKRKHRKKFKAEKVISDEREERDTKNGAKFERQTIDRLSCRVTNSDNTLQRNTKHRQSAQTPRLYGNKNGALNDLLKMNHDRQLLNLF